jgi:hypothetical protein
MCLGLAASVLAVASGGLRKPSLIEIFETRCKPLENAWHVPGSRRQL